MKCQELSPLPGIPLCHQVEEPHVKQSIGSSRSPTTCSVPSSRMFAHSSRDSWRPEQVAFYTGKYWLRSRLNSPSSQSDASSAPSTPSPPGRPPHRTMSGKKTPELMEPSSYLESSPLTETPQSTGRRSGSLPQREILWRYPRISEYKVIARCERLLQTLRNQLEWSELAGCSGVELGLASRGELGKKQVCMLTLRIRYPSSGVATMVNQMLSSMNFGEQSRSRTFSDGWTDIRSTWRSKAVLCHCGQNDCGSLRI